MPSMEDIAAVARVSKATVSRVLSNHTSVRPATRQRVLAAAKQVGYPLSTTAVSGNERTFNLGILHPVDVSHTSPKRAASRPYRSWVTEAMTGLEHTVRQEGYNLFVSYVELMEPLSPFPRFVEMRQVDGVFVVGGLFHDSLVLRLSKTGLPVVVIGGYIDGTTINSVFADNVRGAYTATAHLLQLGHRRIGFINGPPTTRTSSDKLRGYREALDAYDTPYDERLVKVAASFSPENGYQLATDLVKQDNGMSALFCAYVDLAWGALRSLLHHQMRVPEDVALVAYQDESIADITNPSLTCVSINAKDMGMEAGRRMLTVVRHAQHLAVKIAVPTDLVIRRSCGAKGKREVVV